MRRPRAFAALLGLLTLTVALTALATPAYAQRQLGAIQGTINDQTGGVLPGVTVTATNKSTGEVRTTITNEVGIYRLQSLDPGTYDVLAQLSGFGQSGRGDVVVSIGASVGVNLAMKAGGRDRNRAGDGRVAGHPDREGRSLLGRRAATDRGSADCRTQSADARHAAAGHPRSARRRRTSSRRSRAWVSTPAVSGAAPTTRWSTG